jgi:transposase
MEERPVCPVCQHAQVIKFGWVGELQRWQCKKCQYRFTRTTFRGKPASMKAMAIALHGLGLSFNAIGKLFCVSAQAVINWVRKHTLDLPEIQIEQPVQVIELDEMWHFLEKKRTNSGFGKHSILVQIDCLTGQSVIGVPKL